MARIAGMSAHKELEMFLICGESLMDVFAGRETANGVMLDARIGGSPMNVAIGLARLGHRPHFLSVLSNGFLGDSLRRALMAEGVSLTDARRVDAPTTLGLVGLDDRGSPSYAFYGEGCADRLLQPEDLPELGADLRALHFGSYSMVVEPVASAHRVLIERALATRVIAYDPNLRLNVEPDLARWSETVDWMVRRSHIVKVSEEDLSLLHPGVAPAEVASSWRACGVAVVVVTLGSAGAIGFCGDGQVEVPALRVPVVDTVGAGDTFQAALLASFAERGLLSAAALASLSGQQLEAALQFAVEAASITCSRRGADMPRRHELPTASGVHLPSASDRAQGKGHDINA